MKYRQGHIEDLAKIKQLAIDSWTGYKTVLTEKYWAQLSRLLNDDNTFIELIHNTHCIVCESLEKELAGMAFLVSSGNPTVIYDKDMSYIRFVSVAPDFAGQGIGRELTVQCIEKAKSDQEKIVALHTSEIMDKARHIYESLGFTILRELPLQLGKRYWLYTLDIS